MNLLSNLALLTALTLPLAAQRQDATPVQSEPTSPSDATPVQSEPTTSPSGQNSGPQVDPVPAVLFAVDLKVDHDARVATMTSNDRLPFFGFMVAATQSSMLDIAGYGALLQYEAIVATALCKNGVMALDLGPGGWGFNIYLQGIAVSERGVAFTGVEFVADRNIEAK